MTDGDLQEHRIKVLREIRLCLEYRQELLRMLLDSVDSVADVDTRKALMRNDLRLWYLNELKDTLRLLRFDLPT